MNPLTTIPLFFRRGSPEDRAKALAIVMEALERQENVAPDLLALAGRIYKDRFVESNYEDLESRDAAISWFRRAFEAQPNEMRGIHLAILLIASGHQFQNSCELQQIALVLNNLFGRKGGLEQISSFWDVANFFVMSVLAENYKKANECALKLSGIRSSPSWYLKATINNIQTIQRFRGTETAQTFDEKSYMQYRLYQFWIEFFVESNKSEIAECDLRFPVLVHEGKNVRFMLICRRRRGRSFTLTL